MEEDDKFLAAGHWVNTETEIRNCVPMAYTLCAKETGKYRAVVYFWDHVEQYIYDV